MSKIITLKTACFVRIKLKWSIEAAVFEDFIEALAIVPCIISLTRKGGGKEAFH